MDKVDLRREIASYTAPRGRFEVVTVPAQQYLMIDGHGDPNTASAYREALETLYPMAFGLKFHSARVLGRDHTVMPLEGLWWADAMDSFTQARDKSRWSWTLMILVPAWIDEAAYETVRAGVAAKGNAPALDLLRRAELDEGLVVQTLHIGPYDDEGPVLARMHHEFIPQRGLTMSGRHHEIYLGDPRRTAPERLRTILRQPVRAG